MSKNIKNLQSSVSASTTGARSWKETGGRIYSVEATLALASTAAVVRVWGSNSQVGTGTLIGTITLDATTPGDGITFDDYEGSYFFCASEVVSVTGVVQNVAMMHELIA